MALKLGTLFYDFNADTSKLKRKQKEIAKTNKSLERGFKRLGAAITAAFSFEVLRRAALLADSAKLLDARIKNVTKSQREFNKVQKELIKISNDTGSSLKDNVALFEAFVRSGNQLNATNAQVLKLTENIKKLGVIGGTSNESIANGTRQLGQALEGGIVRAEEYNSILENIPLVAKALRDELELSSGQLRKMVNEGRLLSEDVFKAILRQSDKINEKFEKIPPNIARASTKFANNLGQALKQVDSILEVTKAIAGSINNAANTLGGDFKRDTIFIVGAFHEWVADAKNLVVTLVSTAKLMDLVTAKFLTFDETRKKMLAERIEQVKKDSKTEIGENNDIRDKAIANLKAKADAEKSTGGLLRGGVSRPIAEGDLSNIIGTGAQTIPVTGADKIRAAMGDETQVILNALQERNNKILELTKIGQEEKNKLLIESAKIANREIAALQTQQDQMRLDALSQFNDAFIGLLEAAGKDQSALGKAAFLASKALAVANIIVSTQQGAAKALEMGTAGIPLAALIEGLGFASAGIVAGTAIGQTFKGGGRQQGGPVSAGLMHPINENGGPEIFQQGARQFLLPGGKGGMVSPLDRAANDGLPSVIINNNMVGATVSVTSVTREELIFEVNRGVDRAVSQVDSSLARGQGSTAAGLKQGFKTERNIR